MNDPAGLVARSPELGRLAERSPALRRAIERGRPLEAYRALFWGQRRRRFGDLAEVAATMLGHRRVFLKPLTSAPTMFTYNGVGTRLYGASDRDANDGTYLATLFVVVLFLPVFPLGSYLVRDNPQNRGRSWSFLAKVPLSAGHEFWQRGLALAGVGSLLFGLGSAVEGYGHNTLYVVNGLPAEVTAQLDGAKGEAVRPDGHVAIRTTAGKHKLTVRAGEDVIESETVDVPHGRTTVLWNVLGAAPVYEETIVYADKDKAPAQEAPEPQVFCGQSLVSRGSVDYLFVEPDKQVSSSSTSGTLTRTHLAALPGGSRSCETFLSRRGEAAAAANLAMRVARALKQRAAGIDEATMLGELASVPAPEAEAFAKELIARDGSVEAHRFYQDLLLQSGQRPRAIAEYEVHRAAEHESADAEYLALRVQTIDDERRVVDGVVARFPDSGYLRRAQAYVHYALREYGPALQSLEALQKVAPALWGETLGMQADVLLGLGRGEEALTRLLAVADDASTTPQARNGAKLVAYRVARRIGAPEPAVALEGVPPGMALLFRATAGGDVSDAQIAGLDDADVRAALGLVMDARSNPDRALRQVKAASPEIANFLPTSVAVLLLAEAARRGDAELVDKLISPPLTRRVADAIVAAVQRGDEPEEVVQLPLEMRAAIDFVRSRASGVPDKERASRLERAKAGDLYKGPVSLAIAQWPT